MPDDVNEYEFDALAAEYVLGTLDASERAHTHVLLGIDDGFAARVKVWERRLGELHLMVEPVEPDWRVWERVKAKIGGFESNPFYLALGVRETEPEQGQPRPAAPGLWDLEPRQSAPPEPGAAPPSLPEPGLPEVPSPAPPSPDLAPPQSASSGSAALESAPSEPAAPPVESPALTPPEPAAESPAPVSQVPESERTVPVLAVSREFALGASSAQAAGDAARWRRSIRQWRALALLMTLVALVLAGFVATLRNFPDRLPPALRLQFQATAAVQPEPAPPARPVAPPESQFYE